MNANTTAGSPLGRDTAYPAQYDAGLWMVGIALAGFLGWLVAWMAGPRKAALVVDAATGPERPPPITLPQPR